MSTSTSPNRGGTLMMVSLQEIDKQWPMLWISMMEPDPHLGLPINLHKCELFSRNRNSLFPTAVKFSPSPNMIILGSPLGDLIHCTRFCAERCTHSKILLGAITEVA